MIRGAIIAVILLTVLDLCANDGQIVHHVVGSIASFGAASRDAVNGSVFRR